MVIDKRSYQEKIEIYFNTEGKFSDKEIKDILDDIRIVIEQREKTDRITIIKI